MHHGPVSAEIAAGLLALKKRIEAAKIPSSKLDETVNVAVWNIREFGRVKRTDAAIHYIAEIFGQFDLVAIVELRNNLEDLGCAMDYLGDSWKVVFFDWTDDRGGNYERCRWACDFLSKVVADWRAGFPDTLVLRGSWLTGVSW